MKIALGADHGGFEIKEVLKEVLEARAIEIDDVGCHDKNSVDYPDYAGEVASRVSAQIVERGILVCTMGIGMSIAANKFAGVRAALCITPQMAVMSRRHNNANVLVLAGGLLSNEEARAILDAWLDQDFEYAERHARRVDKIGGLELSATGAAALRAEDPEVFAAVADQIEQEQGTINLIASENTVSRAVREAQGSTLTNKYAEGYPGKRWYNGCKPVDTSEKLAIERACSLFDADHANVQPHCGSAANMAVYFAMLEPGDTILAMNLSDGGHLTHGSPANFSGRLFNFVSYGVNRETELIDYDELAQLAREHKPKMIVAGASAYPRILDFERLRGAADSVGAYLAVDMAHIGGLVAGGSHPNPCLVADFVTTTTHKTLRGPRGGVILCKAQYAGDIDRQVFPGIQGGPLEHTIAAKAVCFKEAMTTEFRAYTEQIVRNASVLAAELQGAGLRLVSGGTDNHLMLVDLSPQDITGKDAALALEKARLILNKNTIPFETKSPFETSGIRIGTPAATTRGMKEPEMKIIAGAIDEVVRNCDDASVIAAVGERIATLAGSFPIY